MKTQQTKTILIVDYDKSTSRTFKQILQKQGYIIDIAKDGTEAIQKIKNNNFDAAIISYILPDMDGIDLLLFTAKTMHNATKIITTGFPTLRDGIKVLEAGADAYFSKPIEPKELIRVIEEMLKLQEKENKSSDLTKSYRQTSTSSNEKERKDLLNGLNGLNGAC
jgi:DNA-binding response OmpR family regulator